MEAFTLVSGLLGGNSFFNDNISVYLCDFQKVLSKCLGLFSAFHFILFFQLNAVSHHKSAAH